MPRPERTLTIALVLGILLVPGGVALLGGWWGGEDAESAVLVRPGAAATTEASPASVTGSRPSPRPTADPSQRTGARGGEAAPTPRPSPALPSLRCDGGQTTRVRVLTFNIHKGHRDGQVGLERIAREIRSWSPDVVLLQEVDRFGPRTGDVDQAAWLGQAVGMHHVFGTNVVRGGQHDYGTAILSRYPVTAETNRLLVNAAGMEQRGLLRVQMNIRGQEVAIYNTHLQHTSPAMRLQQITQIRQLVDADPLPKLLGGDLNAGPGSPVHAVATGGLRDVWSVVGTGSGLTAPARAPRHRIDYLLTSPEWTPDAAGVLFSSVSDHRAVYADLSLPSLPDCTWIDNP